MCADRLLPLSYFEKASATSKAGITINISGVGDTKIESDNIIDAEDVDYNE